MKQTIGGHVETHTLFPDVFVRQLQFSDVREQRFHVLIGLQFRERAAGVNLRRNVIYGPMTVLLQDTRRCLKSWIMRAGYAHVLHLVVPCYTEPLLGDATRGRKC